MVWTTVYEVDFRDAHTSLGDTDLNFVGSSFTFEGISWLTPSVARGNPFDQVACTSWGLVSTGLRAVSIANSRMNATSNAAPHVYVSLADLAANTATPFDGDPTRHYLLQVYVSALSGVDNIGASGAGASIYKIDRGVTLGNANMASAGWGRSPLVNYFQSNKSAAPTLNVRGDISLNVPTAMYRGTGSYIDGYAAAFGAGAFPTNDALRFIASYRDDGTDNDNDVVADPPFFRFAAYHNMENFAPNAYDGTIQRLRVLRR